jgi:putative pyruvate formate lyase activating enzyme
MSFIPSHKKISQEDFAERLCLADEILKNCTSCPRNCFVDRTNGEMGTCQSGDNPIVSSYTPHFGEEPVLSGTNGAGNIFLATVISDATTARIISSARIQKRKHKMKFQLRDFRR